MKQLLLLVLLVIAARESFEQSPDMPSAQPNLETIPAGSLIIPMDSSKQNLRNLLPFNMRAYGLVVELLYDSVPVKWAIRSGKQKDEDDFTASSVRQVFPRQTSIQSTSFKAGPFIVTAPISATLRTRISQYAAAHSVSVWETQEDIPNVDIRYTLNFRPYIGVFDDGETGSIHKNVLLEAGLEEVTHFVLERLQERHTDVDPATACYTITTQPHYVHESSALGDWVRQYVESGGNQFAQCASLRSYENSALIYSTDGVTRTLSQNGPAVFVSASSDTPQMQFDGTIDSTVGGVVPDFYLETGAPRASSYNLITNQNSNYLIAAANKMDPNEVGGVTTYLGGHAYVLNTLASINARRMLLNSVLVPSRRNTTLCPNGFGDVGITIDYPISTVLINSMFVYDVNVFNLNSEPATNLNVEIRLAPGLLYSDADSTAICAQQTGSLILCPVASLAAAGNTRLAIAVTPSIAGQINTTAQVSGSFPDSDTSNNYDDAINTVVAGSVDFSISKTVDHSLVSPGQELVFTITVRNNPDGEAITGSNIRVLDTYPNATVVVQSFTASPDSSFDVDTGVWTIDTLAANAEATLVLNSQIAASATPGTQFEQTAEITGADQADLNLSNNRATVTVTVTGLVVEKTSNATDGVTTEGDAVNYVISIRNLGSTAAHTDVTIEDLFPSHLTYVDGSTVLTLHDTILPTTFADAFNTPPAFTYGGSDSNALWNSTWEKIDPEGGGFDSGTIRVAEDPVYGETYGMRVELRRGETQEFMREIDLSDATRARAHWTYRRENMAKGQFVNFYFSCARNAGGDRMWIPYGVYQGGETSSPDTEDPTPVSDDHYSQHEALLHELPQTLSADCAIRFKTNVLPGLNYTTTAAFWLDEFSVEIEHTEDVVVAGVAPPQLVAPFILQASQRATITFDAVVANAQTASICNQVSVTSTQQPLPFQASTCFSPPVVTTGSTGTTGATTGVTTGVTTGATTGSMPTEAVHLDDYYRVLAGGNETCLSVLNNDSPCCNEDFDVNTLQLETGPSFPGASARVLEGRICYTPADVPGNDTLTYTVCSLSNCGGARVFIEITEAIPEAMDDNVTALEDTETCYSVLQNDLDPFGEFLPDSLALLTSSVRDGSHNVTSQGQVCYTPPLNFIGYDLLTYEVCGVNFCSNATLLIDVLPVNDPPVAEDNEETLPEAEESITINVLSNDYDVDSNLDIESLEVVTPPSFGKTFVNNGAITYTYDYTSVDDVVPFDTLVYRICDRYVEPACDEAQVTIWIGPKCIPCEECKEVGDSFARHLSQLKDALSN